MGAPGDEQRLVYWNTRAAAQLCRRGEKRHMGSEPRPVRAAIDIGSNTIHLVVARCWPDHLDILADELDLTRLGESVNVSGAISEEKTQQALLVIAHYMALAERLGAETILLIATEAIRRASNRDSFLQRIEQHTGL